MLKVQIEVVRTVPPELENHLRLIRVAFSTHPKQLKVLDRRGRDPFCKLHRVALNEDKHSPQVDLQLWVVLWLLVDELVVATVSQLSLLNLTQQPASRVHRPHLDRQPAILVYCRHQNPDSLRLARLKHLALVINNAQLAAHLPWLSRLARWESAVIQQELRPHEVRPEFSHK